MEKGELKNLIQCCVFSLILLYYDFLEDKIIFNIELLRTKNNLLK
jgi:hypothetical protein